MNLNSRMLAGCAALAVLSAAPALAADYDPPIFVEEAPEYVPVEVGSGWYLRGDIAYNANKTMRHNVFGVTPLFRFSQYTTPIAGSIGAGYQFTDFMRAEANFGLLNYGRSKLEYMIGVPGIADVKETARNTMWSGIVSLYGDLGTVAGFTPYVGAGAGFVLSKRNYRQQVDFRASRFIDLQHRDRAQQYSLAYTLAAGVAYNINPNLAVDVGYQFLSAPNAQYVSINGPSSYSVRKGVNLHQVKVGLRYALW